MFQGAGFVRKIWDSSNVSLNDFLPPDVNIDAFIKEKVSCCNVTMPYSEPELGVKLSMRYIKKKHSRTILNSTI